MSMHRSDQEKPPAQVGAGIQWRWAPLLGLGLLQASALTATELTNSPNQDFGVWKHGKNGEMEKNG